MATKSNILILENNSSTHQLMANTLGEYLLTHCDNLLEAFELLASNSYDLFIAAVCEGHEQEYKNIEQIKIDKSLTIPILYLFDDDVDLNNKGINYCKIEPISEPYGANLFTAKVDRTIEESRVAKHHQSEIDEVTQAMLSLQNDNAKLYDISRFLQHSFFCKDIPALCEQLFAVTRAFNTTCTMHVHSENNNFFISDGIKHGEKINNQILGMLKDEARIFQFGHDRAVFNWNCASLLVNKLGDDVDNIAMLMDGFEMGFRAIESVDEFNQVLDKYRSQNYDLKIQVAKVVEGVATNITDELGQMGATTMLTIEQEDSLVEIAEQGRSEVDQLFNECMDLDIKLSHIMIKMRTQSENKPVSEANSNGDLDSIDFF